ncbi:MAG: class I SAM-dependent methyltransferase [Candidatus Thermoplasmatota archaeon]|nr:class I SAM-dependent methyltransferase [Candidatus Thermoplasmatota archaeon]
MDHYNSKRVAENYHKAFMKATDDPEMKRKPLERYNKFTSRVKKGGHILDAGCGTGRFVPYFIKNGYKVTGIDSSISMIEIASKEHPDVEFRVMSLCQLGFASNLFDGIWNVATLLHLDESDVMKTFQESKRVLKKDGCLYIATRTKDQTTTLIEDSTEGGKMKVNYYSLDKLLEMLVNSGLEVLESSVEPDDYSRPFDYVYIYAKPSN